MGSNKQSLSNFKHFGKSKYQSITILQIKVSQFCPQNDRGLNMESSSIIPEENRSHRQSLRI